MTNNYLDFSKQLETTKLNLEFNSGLEAFEKNIYGKEHYTFHLASVRHNPSEGIVTGRISLQSLFDLDEEDIEYFKNKCLSKVADQYQEELKQLNLKFDKNV